MYSTVSSPLHLDNEDNTFHDLYDPSFLQHIEDTFINQTRESTNTSENEDADFEVDEPDLSLLQLVTPIRPRGGKAQPVPKSMRFGIVLDNSSPSGQVEQVQYHSPLPATPQRTTSSDFLIRPSSLVTPTPVRKSTRQRKKTFKLLKQ